LVLVILEVFCVLMVIITLNVPFIIILFMVKNALAFILNVLAVKNVHVNAHVAVICVLINVQVMDFNAQVRNALDALVMAYVLERALVNVQLVYVQAFDALYAQLVSALSSAHAPVNVPVNVHAPCVLFIYVPMVCVPCALYARALAYGMIYALYVRVQEFCAHAPFNVPYVHVLCVHALLA